MAFQTNSSPTFLGLAILVGLLGAVPTARAAKSCGAVFDQASRLSDSEIAAQKKAMATPLFAAKGIQHSAARCAADRRVIALYRQEIALKKTRPDCYSAKDFETPRSILSNHEDDMKYCR